MSDLFGGIQIDLLGSGSRSSLLLVMMQQGSQYTLGRRLQQPDHFADQFVLRLDLRECAEAIVT